VWLHQHHPPWRGRLLSDSEIWREEELPGAAVEQELPGAVELFFAGVYYVYVVLVSVHRRCAVISLCVGVWE
jgi:hypothetical protein